MRFARNGALVRDPAEARGTPGKHAVTHELMGSIPFILWAVQAISVFDIAYRARGAPGGVRNARRDAARPRLAGSHRPGRCAWVRLERPGTNGRSALAASGLAPEPGCHVVGDR